MIYHLPRTTIWWQVTEPIISAGVFPLKVLGNKNEGCVTQNERQAMPQEKELLGVFLQISISVCVCSHMHACMCVDTVPSGCSENGGQFQKSVFSFYPYLR